MPNDIILCGTIRHPDGVGIAETVRVELDVPVVSFEFADDAPVRRFTGATAQVAFNQPARTATVRNALPARVLSGSSDATNRYLRERLLANDSDGLTLQIASAYRSQDNYWLGSETNDVLILQYTRPGRARTSEVSDLCFLVDRRRLDALRRKLTQDLPAIGSAPLLRVLAALAVVSEDGPVVTESNIEDVRTGLQEELQDEDQARKIVDQVVAAFDELTQLALTVPPLDRLRVAGSLVLRAPEGTEVTGRDFTTVEIAAEWRDVHDGRPSTVRFRFPASTTPVDATAPFVVTDDVSVPRVSVAVPVTVRVHDLDGAVLWERRFAPTDAALVDLTIEVPLRRPITVTAPKAPPEDANLRLRGRVVVLGKACALRDVLVLIQARAEAEGYWRVVGAATTDSSGNFGMPYPFGRYVEARAVVSLAPSDPVEVPTTAADGDRTISRDFLYLLVEDPYGAPGACGDDDCSCGSADTPDRLPDFSDLIGSDAYSQDIGGSCVNLSKPNRTISEFPFRAVVRLSDPDVGSYRLTRIGEDLETIDVTQRAALDSATEALGVAEAAALQSAQNDATATPNVGTTQVLDAMLQIHPHVRALDVALTAGGPPITLDALGTAITHVDSVTSIGRAAAARLTAAGLAVPAGLPGVVGLAAALRPLVGLAIDTVGSAVRFELVGESGTRTRAPIGLTNPVDWQIDRATPETTPTTSFSQAVSVATGHVLTYKAVFKADGYSLGDLVHSLPLAPGQKKEIVVFDASQSLVGAESQQVSQNERLAMGLVDERDITSSLAGAIDEMLSGSSTARTSGFSAGFGTAGQASGSVGLFSGSGGAVLGVAGGSSKASSVAEQTGSRGVAQFFGEKLRQSILQNAEGYRQLNATVVSTVTQGQRSEVTSEVIANHNHCHSLTMMYFEVLRHYAIFQELSSVEECVFVPFLMARFSTENVAAWRDVLAPALLPLPAETYLQPFQQIGTTGRGHPLVKAFDADQRLRTHYANVDFPAGSYDEEPIRFLKGRLNLRVHLPRPKTRYDRIKSLPVIRKTVTSDEIDIVGTAKTAAIDSLAAGLTLGISTLFTGPPGTNIQYKEIQVLAKQQIFDAFMTLDANFESVPPAKCIRITNFDPTSISVLGVTIPLSGLDFFEDGHLDREQWKLYAGLLGYTDVFAMLTNYFKGRLIAEWDEIFNNEIAPAVYTKVVESLRLSEFDADFTTLGRYTGGDRQMALSVSATTSKSRSALPAQLRLESNSPTLHALRKHVTLLVESARLDYSTSHYSGLLYSGSPIDDLLDGIKLDIPENADERRNPRREDRYLAAALLEHLNANLEHYNKVLWSRLDPDRRYMLLDGFSIQVYDADGTPSGMRSLASVVKNEVITAAGNSLVFPVAPGYHVSGSFVQAGEREGEVSDAATILEHYQPLRPVAPYRVSVPTSGAFMEAVQGACNACEAIEPDRAQDWTRFTTDEPTPISPVTVPEPTPIDWRAAFKEFAAPIVNVQNAPATPAPGAGLAGLSELLANSDVFRDITGLDANQQNAIKTYLSNQENAKAFATMAKEMAVQSHNTRNSGTIMDGITAARDSGMISRDDAGKLAGEHLQHQIDGGAGQRSKEESDQQAAATPVAKAVVDAAGKDKTVTYSRQDGEGNRESATISGEGRFRVDVGWDGVPTVLQGPNNQNCWAAATAMMVSWKQRQSVSQEEAVTPAGPRYVQMYRDGTGLPVGDKDDFLLRVQMRAEPPASYLMERYVELLKKYGPLWITVDSAPGQPYSLHARILIRITQTDEGNAVFTSLDPARGVVAQTFTEFVAAYEEAAAGNPGTKPIPQIVHFIDDAEPTEGFEIEGPFGINKSIHESITLAALNEAGIPVPPAMQAGKDIPTDEFLRGVLWNDDPAVLLFNNHLGGTNWSMTTGVAWTFAFKWAERATENNPTNLTGRSHYFDLQFLHAMAELEGEQPGDTLSKVMLWAEVMYRLSIGDGVPGTDTLAAVPITSRVTFEGRESSANLATFFTDQTLPTGSRTLAHLLTQDTAFAGLELGKRAIGSLLHLVQDSYARGHTRRTLLNPDDRVPGTPDTFKDGTWGRYGSIENFHCYRGQDHDLHTKYDTPPKDVRPNDLSTFNALAGGRDAIEASRRLLTMWKKRTKWASNAGPKRYLEEKVFVLSPNATPADADV